MASPREDVRHSTADVFDDEHAVDDFDAVADGFAPGRIHNGDNRWSIHSEDPSIRSVHAHMADAPRPSLGPSRNSMHKSRDIQNPFSSAEDNDADSLSALERSHSIRSSSTAQYAPGIAHRLSTASSVRTFGRTASPLQGASGPSHPYAMYPQGTNLARTPSVSTTTSTIRAHQPSVLGQGPTHPYSMYPQNVSEHDDEAHGAAQPSHTQSHIPIGFPGQNRAFVRNQGPEGEEQDIIGVDGHSEQLPPYSEYPEDGAPKTIVLPGQVVTPPNGTQLHVPLIQQQQPQRPQSMSDRGAAHGLAEMQQMNSNDSTTAPSSNNKSWSEKSWKEKRKTRFCGIPFWWLLLSFCVVTFIAIVLAASIGGFLANAKKHAGKAGHRPAPRPTTTLLDASPIPTSSSGSPPPTGVYALSFASPQATQSACLTNQSYSSAWACNMYGTPQMAISISYPPDGSSDYEGASLYGFNNASGVNYGTQPPNTHYSQFISVQDDDEPYRGPAFYFQTFYDKFVVVPEDSFPDSSNTNTDSNNQKRTYIDPDWFTQRQVKSGEKPWFCWWNGTFLEAFIYANSTVSQAANVPSPQTTPSPLLTTSTIIEVSGPSTTATLTSASQATVVSTSPNTGSGPGKKRRDSTSWTFADLSSFGYVIKLEERRVPDSPQAYCKQYQILDNGMASPVSDPQTGKTVTVMLGESDPDYSAYHTATYAPSSKAKRDLVSGGCHCEWWSGSE